jgi:uncharacterized repeat protein (TIGR01451 family)
MLAWLATAVPAAGAAAPAQAPAPGGRQAEAAASEAPFGQRLATPSGVLAAPEADPAAGRPGTRPELWRPELAGVRHAAVFPGVDLVYVREGPRLEVALLVAAGVELATIRLDFRGLTDLTLSDAGDLMVTTGPLYSLLRRPRIVPLNEDDRVELRGGWRRRDTEQVGVWAEGAAVAPVAVLIHFEASLLEVTMPVFRPAIVDFGGSAIMIDTIIADDGDSLGDPGETIRYTTTMTNAGDTTAQGTQLDATLDAATAIVPGSLNISPLAVNDAYTGAFGNVTFNVDAASGVLNNDRDPPGVSCATCTITAFDAASANGGDVALNADGSFTYDPPSGFEGDDTFTYTLQDDHATTPLADSGTVTITVADPIWFVDSSAPAGGNGRQATPYQTLAEVQAAAGPGDIIRVRQGNSDTTPYAGGIVLEAQQQLIGGGVDLVVGGTLIEAADGAAVIANAAGDVVTLADGSHVEGVELRPTASAGIAASGVLGGTVTGVAIDIQGGTSDGIRLVNSGGVFTFESVSVTAVGTPTTGAGVRIDGGNADVDFVAPAINITSGRIVEVANTTGGAVDFSSGSLSNTGGTGIRLADADGNLTIASTTTVTISNATSTPITVAGSSAPVDNTGTLTIDGATIAANGAFPLISGSNTLGAINLADVTLSHSGGRLIDFDDVDGGATIVPATVTTTNHAGIRIVDSGGATLTVMVDNVIGAGTPASAPPLYLENNAGATIGLGALRVNTAGAVGIFANNSGTVTIGGNTNFVTAASSAALSITDTVLSGGSGTPLTFASLTSTNAAGDGIVLNGVGGSMAVTGNTDIDSPAGDGIDIAGATATLAFGSTLVDDTGAAGLNLTGNAGTITFAAVAIDDTTGAGVSVVNGSGAVAINGGTIGETAVTGTTTAGHAVNVSGGTGTVSVAAAIVNTANRAVLVDGKAGGSVTFLGAIDENALGIALTNNVGATIAFNGGNLDIDTGANVGFSATGGGTVTVSGAGNTIDTTTATALNVVGTSIGAAGVAFRSISSTGGSATGIILDNTGTAGGLSVAGDATNTTRGGNGSGGTIANKSGSDGATTTGNGIYLNATSDVSLARMHLSGFQNSAIRGFNVTDFTLQYSTIDGSSGDSSAATEGAVALGTIEAGLVTGVNGIAGGTNLIDNCLISGAVEHNIELYNYKAGSNFTFTVQNSDVQSNSVASGSDGILIETSAAYLGTATVVVDNVAFDDNKSQAVQASALGSSTIDITVSNNTVQRTSQGNEGIVLSNGSNGRLIAQVTGNTISGLGGAAIFVGQVPGNANASASPNLVAVIANNSVRPPPPTMRSSSS